VASMRAGFIVVAWPFVSSSFHNPRPCLTLQSGRATFLSARIVLPALPDCWRKRMARKRMERADTTQNACNGCEPFVSQGLVLCACGALAACFAGADVWRRRSNVPSSHPSSSALLWARQLADSFRLPSLPMCASSGCNAAHSRCACRTEHWAAKGIRRALASNSGRSIADCGGRYATALTITCA
jgi:hypothetical protein